MNEIIENLERKIDENSARIEILEEENKTLKTQNTKILTQNNTVNVRFSRLYGESVATLRIKSELEKLGKDSLTLKELNKYFGVYVKKSLGFGVNKTRLYMDYVMNEFGYNKIMKDRSVLYVRKNK